MGVRSGSSMEIRFMITYSKLHKNRTNSKDCWTDHPMERSMIVMKNLTDSASMPSGIVSTTPTQWHTLELLRRNTSGLWQLLGFLYPRSPWNKTYRTPTFSSHKDAGWSSLKLARQEWSHHDLALHAQAQNSSPPWSGRCSDPESQVWRTKIQRQIQW